jgi:hypothetical protein
VISCFERFAKLGNKGTQASWCAAMAETRKEDDRLFKAVVNKMLRTPPKPHEDMKVRKSKTKSLKPWAKSILKSPVSTPSALMMPRCFVMSMT